VTRKKEKERGRESGVGVGRGLQRFGVVDITKNDDYAPSNVIGERLIHVMLRFQEESAIFETVISSYS
jgi:hypothetical protein